MTHYYREPYPYVRQKVAVIGARNSAAKAALDCYRHGAQVTLIVRSPALSDKIKYWIKPDLENRIAEGSIRAFFSTTIDEIRESSIALRTPDGPVDIENDWVLAMTGYHPDYGFLEALDIDIADDAYRTPVVRPGHVRNAAVPACTSQEPSAAGTRPAAGSSRTAATTRGRSSSTSRTAGPNGCRSSGSTGRPKSKRRPSGDWRALRTRETNLFALASQPRPVNTRTSVRSVGSVPVVGRRRRQSAGARDRYARSGAARTTR